MQRTIVWFRNDLRLHDNPALWEAARNGIVIPLFILPEEGIDMRSTAARWWQSRSVASFEKELRKRGVQLIIKSGDAFDAMIDVMEETDANAVYFNEQYGPDELKMDKRIAEQLTAIGIDVQNFNGNLLFDPGLKNKQGEPYKVFTSFWKRGMQETVPSPLPVPQLEGLGVPASTLPVDRLDTLAGRLRFPELEPLWQPGERTAIEQWEQFSDDGLLYYGTERNLISSGSSSLLSPYIAAGSISVRSIWHSAKRIAERTADITARQSINVFLRQLIWRDFAYHQLIHYPNIIRLPLRKQFLDFPWQGNEEQLSEWKEGQTGYPLVDAGMRELLHTGVIHNRVRMVAASFLVKHLLISWQVGAEWFKERLIDFDAANNAMGWQWVTGSGIDAAPYFRIFNPILQSEKFDSEGDYIRKWVSELSNLPVPYIHKPWQAPASVLEKAGIQLGSTYPMPIVDHAAARKRALQAFQEIKRQ